MTASARPLTSLAANDGVPDWLPIEKLFEEYKPALLVVGLPLGLDGEATPMSVRAKKFANRLHGRFGLPVELHDERFSSKAAKQAVRDREYSEQRRSGRRQRGAALDAIDAEAATLILESFFAREDR